MRRGGRGWHRRGDAWMDARESDRALGVQVGAASLLAVVAVVVVMVVVVMWLELVWAGGVGIVIRVVEPGLLSDHVWVCQDRQLGVVDSVQVTFCGRSGLRRLHMCRVGGIPVCPVLGGR